MPESVVIPDPGTVAPGVPGGSEALMSRIADLEDALARERAKNQVLMEQVLQLEDGQADTDVDTFSDVIPNDSRSYWRDLLLDNRAETVAELTRMRNRCGKKPVCANADPAPGSVCSACGSEKAVGKACPSCGAADKASVAVISTPVAPVASRVPPKPLHNRAAAAVPAATAFGGQGVSPVTGDRAVWIRNRAQAISKEDGCSYTKAFARAEAECKAKG